MYCDTRILPPILFNPLKHHLGFIKSYVHSGELREGKDGIIRDIRQLGSSLTDVYSGTLDIENISSEIFSFLVSNSLESRTSFAGWAGTSERDFRQITLSDGSLWILKSSGDQERFTHIFPARNSILTFRIKANTLKSAILYLVFIDKDYVSAPDINRARAFCRLSPVRSIEVAESICEMIEILRN